MRNFQKLLGQFINIEGNSMTYDTSTKIWHLYINNKYGFQQVQYKNLFLGLNKILELYHTNCMKLLEQTVHD